MSTYVEFFTHKRTGTFAHPRTVFTGPEQGGVRDTDRLLVHGCIPMTTSLDAISKGFGTFDVTSHFSIERPLSAR